MGNNVLGANRLGERLSNPGSMPSVDGGNGLSGNTLGQTGDQNTGGLISGMIGGMPGDTPPQLPPGGMPDLGGTADNLRGMITPRPMPVEGGGGDVWNRGSVPVNRGRSMPRPVPLGMPGGNPTPQPPSGDMSNPVAKQPMRRMPRQPPNQEAGRRRISMF